MKTTNHHPSMLNPPSQGFPLCPLGFGGQVSATGICIAFFILLAFSAWLPLGAQEVPAPAATSGAEAATGPRALRLENVDIRQLLQAMAKDANISVILADDVKGTITARLVGLTPLEAMKVIVQSKGYTMDYDEKSKVYQIKSTVSISQEPLVTEIYQFSNANAIEAKPTVDKLVSKTGSAQLDARSNTLVITDTRTNLDKILVILKTLDRATPQVLIETRLLETQHNPTLALGIRWNDSFSSTLTPGNGIITDGSGQGKNNGFEMQRTALPQVQGNNIPLATLVGAVPAIAVLSLPQLRATMNILNQSNDTTLLGNPKVLTVDNKEAKINIATLEPIPQFAFNSATATFGISGFDFRPIGNVLTVTPHINKDNIITMDVVPEVSDRGTDAVFPLNGAGASVSIPRINQRTLSTRVAIPSGHTLALGGLLSQGDVRTYNKVPFLGDIPLIGELFTNRNFSKNKRNLLIFITPTVIGPNDLTGFEDQYSKLKDESEDDRFAYKKNLLIGNGDPRDQFKSVTKNRTPSNNQLAFDTDQIAPEEIGPTLPVKTMDFDTQENLIHAKLMLRETERLFSQGDYATALSVAQDAEKKLIGVTGGAVELARCRQYQSACLFRLAQQAFHLKDYTQAYELAKKAYQLDPKSREAFLLEQEAAKQLSGAQTAPPPPAPPEEQPAEQPAKEETQEEPAPEKGTKPVMNRDQVAPRLAPSLRE